MPYEITVTVCDRGTISCQSAGLNRLASDHGAEIVESVAAVIERAALATPHADERASCRHACEVSAKVLERARMGKSKYGVTVESNPLSIVQWLQHLQEELMDAAVYVERLMEDAKG